MKIGDIFFAIGIIIISSLLVFVVYDDIMNPYPIDIYEDMEFNVSDANTSENDTKLITYNDGNKTINIEIDPKTKQTHIQNSNSASVTQKSDTKTSSVQNSKSPTNNVDNNIKTYSRDMQPSSFSNMHNDKAIRQNEPVNTKKGDKPF